MSVYKVQTADACDATVDARESGKGATGDAVPREPVMRRVPEKPTTAMLAAGSAVGRVSVETAWNIWMAMLKAAA